MILNRQITNTDHKSLLADSFIPILLILNLFISVLAEFVLHMRLE